MPTEQTLQTHRGCAVEVWYLRWSEFAKKSALAVLCSQVPYSHAQLVAEDIVQELAEAALTNAQLLEKTEASNGSYLAAAARNLAIDTLRRTRRHRSLENLLYDEIDGRERAGLPAALAGGPRGEPHIMEPSAEVAYQLQEMERTAEAHARLNDWFTGWTRRRLERRAAKDRQLRRRLGAGARALILKALYKRPSLLATLLDKGPRDSYRGAAEEAALVSMETSLSIGRVRNLRTELLTLLRVQLAPEIRVALVRLASLWDTTPERAAELHLRWAEGL